MGPSLLQFPYAEQTIACWRNTMMWHLTVFSSSSSVVNFCNNNANDKYHINVRFCFILYISVIISKLNFCINYNHTACRRFCSHIQKFNKSNHIMRTNGTINETMMKLCEHVNVNEIIRMSQWNRMEWNKWLLFWLRRTSMARSSMTKQYTECSKKRTAISHLTHYCLSFGSKFYKRINSGV